MPAASGPNAAPGRAPPGPDLVVQLASLVSGPTPRLLIVKGPPGSGKSSLLRALVPRLGGPVVLVAYRVVPSAGSPDRSGAPDPPAVSLLIVDPGRPPGTERPDVDRTSSIALPLGPAGATSFASMPAPLKDALARLTTAGGGCVVVDSWDRANEEALRRGVSDGAAVSQLVAPTDLLRELLGRVPVHVVLALFGEPDPQVESLADGIVELSTERVEDVLLRTLRLAKLRGSAALPSRLFSVANGHFYSTLPRGTGFRPPIGPAEVDPASESAGLWPGSSDFASAFGRLREHGLTAFELGEEIPDRLFDPLVAPMVATALRGGGRVVWVPPGSSSAAHLVTGLERFVSRELLAQNFRVLSAGGPEPNLRDIRSVVLPLRRGAHDGGDTRSADAPPLAPMFPEAHAFLRDARGNGPVLFVLSIDGLRALAMVAQVNYNESTLPHIVASYARLPRFHGIGFGRARDPFTQALLPSVDTYLKIRQAHGDAVVFGIRPPTPAYLLDWTRPDGRYSLVPIG